MNFQYLQNCSTSFILLKFCKKRKEVKFTKYINELVTKLPVRI